MQSTDLENCSMLVNFRNWNLGVHIIVLFRKYYIKRAFQKCPLINQLGELEELTLMLPHFLPFFLPPKSFSCSSHMSIMLSQTRPMSTVCTVQACIEFHKFKSLVKGWSTQLEHETGTELIIPTPISAFVKYFAPSPGRNLAKTATHYRILGELICFVF